MRTTKLFPRTRYGELSNTPTMAHSLLLKGGFIKQVAPGLYILLPLGFRVWRKIRNIVWDVMEEHGVQNLQLPILQPAPTLPADLLGSIRIEHTPDVKTVEGLCRLFPELDATRMIKTIIFTVNAELGQEESYEIAVCIRGDLEINQVKLTNVLNALSVVPAEASVVREVTGAEVGFAGPIGLKNVRRILFDQSTKELTHILCGLNKTDYHALDVVPGKDFEAPERYYNLHLAMSGHGCVECQQGELKKSCGIEVGHVFMLQTAYAEKMGATYLGEDGQPHAIWMGCYGIGTTRLIQAVVSQNFDAEGIVWPEAVAPFQVTIVPTRYDYEDQKKLADELYERLKQKGLSVLLDDRDERAGVKFKDADLIGCPWRINIGRKAQQGIVELRNRRTKEMVEITIDEVVAKL